VKKRCTEINIIRTFFDLIGTMVHVFILYYGIELDYFYIIFLFYDRSLMSYVLNYNFFY